MDVVLQSKMYVKDPLSQDSKSKSVWLLFTQIVLWQILAIIFVEGVLFLAGLGEEDIYKLDPELGTRHMTNKRVTWRSEGFSVSYFNWDGMREPGLRVEKPAGTLRIAILGDSLAEGLQVPIEMTFGKQLERMLTKNGAASATCDSHSSGGRPVEVLNFSTSGYSTVQEYLQLKRQVFKYKPDLVIVGYNYRDIVENWSTPGQIAVNVRPNALQLPKTQLVIDFLPVKRWLKTPRGRFLQSISWIRENSRIWGILSALDSDWNQNNSCYHWLSSLLSNPAKAIMGTGDDLKNEWTKQTSLLLQSFAWNKSSGNSVLPDTAAKITDNYAKSTPMTAGTLQNTKNVVSDPGNNAGTKNMQPATMNAVKKISATNKTKEQRTPYEALLERTLGSLLEEMSRECKNHGANFTVIALPVYSALCEDHSKDTKEELDYFKEMKMLREITSQKHLPFFDCCTEAMELPQNERRELFYLVHLTSRGHKFVASKTIDFVKHHLP